MTSFDIDQVLDSRNARQQRKIYWDEDIYAAEQEHIFARCWLFLTHESLIPEPGDFATARMGEDEVIVVRQNDGSIGAFLNACTHRGNVVCKADRGNAKTFTCSYHGWAFGIDGALEQPPLENLAYQGKLDLDAMALHKVAQVDSYKGLVFGTFDASAPPLEEYLGDIKDYIDCYLDPLPGGTECIAGPMKYRLPCNWKYPAENFICDSYHVGWTHVAGIQILGKEPNVGNMSGNDESSQNSVASSQGGFEASTRFGHGCVVLSDGMSGGALHDNPDIGWNFIQQNRPLVADRLSELRSQFFGSHCNLTVFPNFSTLPGDVYTWRVWNPVGPREIEVTIWTIVPKAYPDELKEEICHVQAKTFGPAGFFEGDDSEPLEEATRGNRGFVTRQQWLYNGMGEGLAGPHPELPGVVQEGVMSEVASRGFYAAWADHMRDLPWNEVDRDWQQTR